MAVQAEANLSALLESSDDPIWSVDLQYRLLAFNSALQRNSQQNFGVSAAIGMKPTDFPAEANGDAWIQFYDRALAEGPFRSEFRVAGGRILELSFNPILENGKPAGVSVFSKDVTERRAAETALQAAEKRYRDLFDGAVEGMFQTSLVDDFRTANLAATRMLGFDSPDELVAAMHANPENVWVNPAERKKFRERLFAEGEVHGFECQWKRKDGSPVWVSMSSRLIYDEGGKAVSHEGFVKNINERKRATGPLSNRLRWELFTSLSMK
jgi:PAS domain S-box-containing protein